MRKWELKECIFLCVCVGGGVNPPVCLTLFGLLPEQQIFTCNLTGQHKSKENTTCVPVLYSSASNSLGNGQITFPFTRSIVARYLYRHTLFGSFSFPGVGV